MRKGFGKEILAAGEKKGKKNYEGAQHVNRKSEA